MSQLQFLKKIIHSLQSRHLLQQSLLQGIIAHSPHPTVFRLIMLIYNETLNTRSDILDNRKKMLVILQELTLIIGGITSFTVPLQFIATFQKHLFYNHCRDNKEFSCLLNKVFGLFPSVNIEYKVPKLMQFDTHFTHGNELGNPNWMLTRYILTQWLQKNQTYLTKDIVLSTYMLLSSQKLIDLNYGRTLWDQMWTILYLWLNTVFLNPFVFDKKIGVSWCNYSDSHYRSLIKELYKDSGSKQDQIIYNLILFIIEEFIFGEVDNDYFKQSAQTFQTLPQYTTTWQSLLLLQLTKIVSQKLGHNNLSILYENHIHQLVLGAEPQKSNEFQYLLPHLLPKGQVKEYIITNRLQFWNYGLEKSINEEIAIIYLQKFNHFIEQEQRINILLNLSKDYFIQHILHSNLLADNSKLGQAIVKVILKYPQRIGSKLYSAQEKYSQLQCIKYIEIYGQQWDIYYTVKYQGIDQSNFQSVSQLLTFDVSQIKAFSSFPQRQPRIYAQVLTQFTDYFLSNPHEEIREVFLNPIFVDYFAKLQQPLKDILCKKWGEYIMYNQEMMGDLMQIDPLDHYEQQQFLSDERIYQLRKNR